MAKEATPPTVPPTVPTDDADELMAWHEDGQIILQAHGQSESIDEGEAVGLMIDLGAALSSLQWGQPAGVPVDPRPTPRPAVIVAAEGAPP